MSKASIAAKALQIRNETQDYANTKGRVADVLDDINDTKPDEIVVADMIEEALEGFDLTTKINKPTWSGVTEYYFVKSDAGNNNLQQFTLTTSRVPYWTGNNFANSPIIVSADGNRVGIGGTSTSEVLEVYGNAKANALILPANLTSAVANRLRSDGTNLYFSNGSSVERMLAMFGSIFEHNVRGKVLTATGVSGTYICDLNAYTRWILTLAGNTTINFSNMILDDETVTISMNVTGNFTLNFPSWLRLSPYSDLYDGTKVNRIVIEIGKGGNSPSGWYNIIKFDS